MSNSNFELYSYSLSFYSQCSLSVLNNFFAIWMASFFHSDQTCILFQYQGLVTFADYSAMTIKTEIKLMFSPYMYL